MSRRSKRRPQVKILADRLLGSGARNAFFRPLGNSRLPRLHSVIDAADDGTTLGMTEHREV